MYVRREKSWLKHLDFGILDVISIIVAFYIGYVCRHGADSGMANYYVRLLCILIVLDICVSLIRSSHTAIVRRSYLREMLESVTHCVSIDGMALFLLFLMQETGIYSRESLLIYFVLHVIFTYILRCVRKHMLRKKMTCNPNVEQMLIFTNRDGAEQCVRELSQDEYRNYQVIGVVLMDDIYESADQTAAVSGADQDALKVMQEAAATEEIEGVPVVSDYHGVRDYLMEHVVDSVFLNVQLDSRKSRRLNHELIRAGVTVHINLVRVPDDIPNRTVERLGNYTVLTTGLHLASARQVMMKRLLDIAGGLVGSFLTVLISIFIGPVIYLQSPGPIFFAQERIGLGNKPFKMYKFRSMRVQDEKQEKKCWTVQNDPRITGVGKFIRKTSIDELPQLFNVLRGDMSLIGPRPERPFFVKKFQEVIPRYMIKHQVHPGMTGWAQVNGYRGDTSIAKRIECDLYYVENWTLWLDFKILFLTFFGRDVNKNAC